MCPPDRGGSGGGWQKGKKNGEVSKMINLHRKIHTKFSSQPRLFLLFAHSRFAPSVPENLRTLLDNRHLFLPMSVACQGLLFQLFHRSSFYLP